MDRGLKKLFRNAKWSSSAELNAYIAQVGICEPKDLVELLEMLIDPTISQEISKHRARCQVFEKLVEGAPQRSMFTPLVQALEQGDNAVQKMCENLLPLVNNVESHGALCRALGSKDRNVRSVSSKLLSELGGAPAFSALLKLVKERDFHGRAEAMEVMAPKAKYRALPLLKTVLDVGNPMEKARALRWIGQQEVWEKDPRAAAKLALPYLGHDHERVSAQALSSFARIVNERTFFKHAEKYCEDPNPNRRRSFIDALRAYRSVRVYNFLARALRTEIDPLRLAVIEVLEENADDDAIPLLVEALSDRRVEVRNRASQVIVELAQIGRVDLARTVIWLLKNQDVNVRRMAAELSRQLGTSAAEMLPQLLRHLRDEDWWVRERVMDTLVELGGKKLTRHIVEYLNDDAPVVRRYAVGALKRIKDPESLGALLRIAMDDEDWWTREEAISTIAELGDEKANQYLIQMLFREDGGRVAVIDALRKLQAHEAAPLVAQALSDEDSASRSAAVRFLDDLNEASFASEVAKLKNDPDRFVRKKVNEVLSRWDFDAGATTFDTELDELNSLLIEVHENGADDLILSAERRPYIKRLGKIEPLRDVEITDKHLRQMLFRTLRQEQRDALDNLEEVDYSVQVKSHGLRFRGNVFAQRTGLAAVFRIIRNELPDFEALGLPAVVQSFADFKNGLVLIGGPTGSGKSTTLATLIQRINDKEPRHIVTIEDPIEFVYERNVSLINQREVGTDARDFHAALKSVLRQDPDVILVGEMRDLDTISFAITAAETGHLVFGTVHTTSADAAIDRLLHVFPPGQRRQIRSMLSESLRAVVCQQLLRRRDEPDKRVLAAEILITDDAVANLIRKDKSFQIPTVLTMNRDRGMQRLDHHLEALVRSGVITRDDALLKSNDPVHLENLLEGKSELERRTEAEEAK